MIYLFVYLVNTNQTMINV